MSLCLSAIQGSPKAAALSKALVSPYPSTLIRLQAMAYGLDDSDFDEFLESSSSEDGAIAAPSSMQQVLYLLSR